MKRHALKTGVHYALKTNAIDRDADGFFVLVGESIPDNEPHGTVVKVHIRGALSQFNGDGGDNYESIVERVASAFTSEPKPTAVVLCISSPGGIVAGLNEAVFKLQRMRKESGIPLVAYVNELAASAAYALCCACSEVLCPESGIVGSVGTISTMVSVARKDRAEGVDFRIITSGIYKSDGHPHADLSDRAERTEKARNAELAAQFFALAGKARGLSPATVERMQAAIYVGKRGKDAGLVDDIISLDDALMGLDKTETPAPKPTPNTGNVTDRRAKDVDNPSATRSLSPKHGVTINVTPGDPPMPVKLDALIKKTQASISIEPDPKRLRALHANLSAFLATKAEMDDGDDDDKKKNPDDDDDGDEESKSAKAAKKAESAKKAEEKAKIKSKRADAVAKHAKLMEELDEEEAKCAESEEEEARIRAGHQTSAHLSPGAAAAVASQGEMTREALTRIEKLEKEASDRLTSAMISEAKAARRITPGEAKALAKKPAAFVRDFLEMRPKALVATDEEALAEPDRTTAADVPALTKQIVEADIKLKALTGEAAAKYREESYAAHRAAQAGATNGAAGVY